MRESVVVCVLLSAMASAQTPVFTARPQLPRGGSMAWDSRQQVLVVLEGNTGRLWHWDGREFRLQLGPAHPAAAITAYDPVRGEVRAFGNYDVKTWNGANWSSTAVPMTNGAAFDVVRRRLVLRSGNEMREWDGQQLTVTMPPTSPPGNAPLCFDPSRGKCVTVGGDPLGVYAWDGSLWQTIDQQGPGGLGGATFGLAFDPGANRLLVQAVSPLQMWSFAAGGWIAIPTPAALTAMATLGFDGVGMLRLGDYDNHSNGPWRLEGNTWRQLPPVQPALRLGACVASAPASAGVLWFGGRIGNTMLADTWVFDGSWRLVAPANSPPGRHRAGLAWSQNDGEFVLFGGIDAQNQRLADTWTFDGRDWTLRPQTQPPPARELPCLVAEPGGTVALFGGLDSRSQPVPDQWRWSNHAWQNLGQLSTVAVQWPLVAAFDPVRQRTVAVGSYGLWEWDGASWTQPTSLPGTMGGYANAITWRPQTARMLVFDGSTGRAGEWDGAQWATYQAGAAYYGTQIEAGYLATDHAHGQVVSFQHQFGYNSPIAGTAAVLTATPAAVGRFGQGCAIGAMPGLVAAGRPVPGDAAFALDAATLAPGALCAIALGFQQQPQHLGAGCVAWFAPAAVQFVLADAAGHARLPVPLPNAPALLGAEFLAQAITVDPPRGLYGPLTFSDGLRLAIGD